MRTTLRLATVSRLSALLGLLVCFTRVAAQPARRDAGGGQVSEATVRGIIRDAARTKPNWWDDVKADYPSTLDLTWPKPSGPWDPQKNVGQYIVSVVNPSPGKWRSAAKLLEEAIETTSANRNDEGMQDAMNWQAHVYARLLGDYARGAARLEEMIKRYRRMSGNQAILLAECYWKLGSKSMAMDMLDRVDRGKILLLGAVGEPGAALEAAREEGRSRPFDAYCAAGNVCRAFGKFPEARGWYEKAIRDGASQFREGMPARQKQWAQQDADAVRVFEKVDLKDVPDGTYEGTAEGFRGPINVSVTVSRGRLTDVKVTSHREDWPGRAPSDIPEAILKNQGVKGVDAMSGATKTSDSVIAAYADALRKAK